MKSLNNIGTNLSCKLSSPELRTRKQNVIATLKQLAIEKQETDNGFRYSFDGSDKTLDLLIEFIKAERICCDFFTFSITVADSKTPLWLELSGPDGVKDFINNEIEF